VHFNENSSRHVSGKMISSLLISSNKSELLLIFLGGKIDNQKTGQFRLSLHPDESRPLLCLKKSTCPGKNRAYGNSDILIFALLRCCTTYVVLIPTLRVSISILS